MSTHNTRAERIAVGIDDSGPAFPCRLVNDTDAEMSGFGGTRLSPHSLTTYCGISVRDYFAARAMEAAATNPTGADGFTFEQRAEWAYAQADAMLKARDA